MADAGPYAHLNRLSERDRSRIPQMRWGDGPQWPAVLAQDPGSGSWRPVPVDPNGHPRFDLVPGTSSDWKTIDPSDSNALRAANVDALGFPHDYSWRGRFSDAVMNALGWPTSFLPRPQLELGYTGGGIRGDLDESGADSVGRSRWAGGENMQAMDAGRFRPADGEERPELRVPPPIFFS